MFSLEFFPKEVSGTIMLPPLAGVTKRHPEVEVLLVTGDNRTEITRKVTDWLTEVEQYPY